MQQNFYSPQPVESSKYNSLYKKKLVMECGNFYIFDKYVVGEIKEGNHFDWDTAIQVIDAVYAYFGTNDIRVSYISNRINSYSVQPKDWINFFKDRHKINCIAIVAYNKQGLLSLVLEKIFAKAPIKKFESLENAINWVVAAKFDTVKR